MHAIADWIPLMLRWLVVVSGLTFWQTWAARRLALRSWPRSEAVNADRIAWSYCVFLVAIAGVETVVERSAQGTRPGELLPWSKILLGFNPAGWVTTLALLLPPFWVVPTYRSHLLRPLEVIEARFAALQREPARAFEADGAHPMLREMERLKSRLPPELQERLETIRRSLIDIMQRPPPAVCLDRAVTALKLQPNPNLHEALYWLERWDPNAIETLLVRVEMKDWRGCLDVVAHQPGGELQEEILQLVAEVPKSEELRNEARSLLAGTMTMRRRRARLEFAAGVHPDDVAGGLDQFGDWEAVTWVRAAARTTPSNARTAQQA